MTAVAAPAAGRSRCGTTGRGRPRGFTLVELLVVISVLALLGAVLLPYLSRTFELAYKTMCQRNLRTLTDALHMGHEEDVELPTAGSWVSVAESRTAKEVLFCKEDTREEPESQVIELEELYVLQYHSGSDTNWDTSYLTAILGAGGAAVNDPQVWAWYPAGGIHDTPKGDPDRPWTPDRLPTLKENQAFIGVDNDSALLITFGDEIIFECWEPIDKQYSRHWLMKGPGTPVCPLPTNGSPDDDDDKELLHMWSRDYRQIDPRSPLRLGAGSWSSYGMNGMIEARKFGLGQIMLADANETIIRIGSRREEAYIEEVIQYRHMGKANVASVDSSVRAMTREEIEREYDNLFFEDRKSAWRPH
jgi:prepilin-type N-terminal cleavage/methylation domain-containing protein